MKKPKPLARRLNQWFVDGEKQMVQLAHKDKVKAVQDWHRKGRAKLDKLLGEL